MPSVNDGLERLLSELDDCGHRLHRWQLLTAVLYGAAALLWFVLVFVLADFLNRFGPATCWLAWLALVVGCGLAGAGLVALQRRRLSASRVSLMLERCRPSWQNRLINIIRFAESQDARGREFAGHLHAEQALSPGEVAVEDVFPRWLRQLAQIAVGAALLVSVITFLANPRGTAISVKRLLLPMLGTPPMTLTTITEVSPGDVVVATGSVVDLAAAFRGALPRRVHAELQFDSGVKRDLTMLNPPGVTRRYEVRTPALFEDVSYRVHGGDTVSASFTIHVASPPQLVTWSATVQTPAYTGLGHLRLNAESESRVAPVGSTVELTAAASAPLRSVALRQGGETLAEAVPDGTDFAVSASCRQPGPLQFEMTAETGLAGLVEVPIELVPDASPVVACKLTERRLTAIASAVPLPFVARDDYGVRQVFLQVLRSAQQFETVAELTVKTSRERDIEDRLVLDLDAVGARPGAVVRVRLGCLDFGPEPEQRAGYSRIIEVVRPKAAERETLASKSRQASQDSVAELIRRQQQNLSQTEAMRNDLENGGILADSEARQLVAAQNEIRALAQQLSQATDLLGDLANQLERLVREEMTEVVGVLEQVTRAAASECNPLLQQAVVLERRILAALRGVPESMDREFAYQNRADLLNVLQKLVKDQRRLLKDTKDVAETAAAESAGLVDRQDAIAGRAVDFIEAAERQVGAPQEHAEDDFIEQLRRVIALLQEAKVYETMLTAGESLAGQDWPAAIQSQEEALTALLQALDIMNRWRVKKARETLADANATLTDVAEKLSELEKRQHQITEVARDLLKRGELDDQARGDLGKLDEEQKKWLETIEQMAQDLYQFPELPVGNELNAKMREVFEDTEQAAESANAPSVEVAVQKEDALLEAIRNTKERVEDVEMWLPDKPDNIEWKLESFDAAEFPEIPLTPLPEELEDLVGELLDQATEIDQQSQDATGNQIIADAEMGWDVMDGPMPSFAAKGKSGNTKPNDNEMTGRSGAGREGQSNGELVENKVKGLEGRETHARRTQDPFQKGQVEEEEGSTMDARATGGGKLGGESETDGMFGNAPRRDTDLPLGPSMRGVRQETEALYAKARLLYLGNTANLGAAANEMRMVERYDKEMKSFEPLQRRVLRRLSDAHTEIDAGVALPLPAGTGGTLSGGSAAMDDVDLGKIDADYRGMISDYYRNLGQ